MGYCLSPFVGKSEWKRKWKGERVMGNGIWEMGNGERESGKWKTESRKGKGERGKG